MAVNIQKQIQEQLARQSSAAEWFMKTPADTSNSFVDYVEWTSTSRRLDYGCILDHHLTPPLPGDYISVMGRPGNKKSKFMSALAKRYSTQIVQAGAVDKEVVIYATWDEATENLESYISASYGGFSAGDVAWGKVTKKQAIKAAIARTHHLAPLWVWGKSIMDNDYKKPPFTADWLFDTVQAVRQKYKLTVKALFLDYLQIIPVTTERSRTEQVTKASKQAKELAKEIGCPVFAGVQAGRDTDSSADKIPGWADAQHASAIEQDSTKQLAIMNPIKYAKPEQLALIEQGLDADPFFVRGRPYELNDDLTIIRILKQRGARGAGTYPVGIGVDSLDIFDPAEYGDTLIKNNQVTPQGQKIVTQQQL